MVEFLSFLTLLSNIVFVLVAISYLLTKFLKLRLSYFDIVADFLTKRSLALAFLIATVATSGSLYFSEIAGFTPCKFCWLQRIFMYPQVIILGMALFKKTRDVIFYSLPLTIIGVLLAGYHYTMQISPNPLSPCSAIGLSVSCSERFFTHYGYITIPWMSFSAFVLISLLLLVSSGKMKLR